MALASHRQGRAALLEDEQIASLQTIYNEHGEKDKEPFSLLHLNPLQQERIRLLLWEQGEAWRALLKVTHLQRRRRNRHCDKRIELSLSAC